MKYLMIENDARHIPTVNMLATLGLSGSRSDGSTIGQFGSGWKYAVALLARTPYYDDNGDWHSNMLEDTVITMGRSVCKFALEDKSARHASGEDIEYRHIYMQGRDAEHTGENRRYDLNMSASFGEMDWTNITMALREFVANAIDGQYYSGAGKPNFEIVETNQRGPRAKAGKIRVYVPLTDAVRSYYDSLPVYFAMLKDGYDPSVKIMNKPTFTDGLLAYRSGVLVHIKRDAKALYAYNLPIELDESRNAQTYAVKEAIAKAIAYDMNAEQFANVLATPDSYEYEVLKQNSFYMKMSYESEDLVNSRRAVFNEAARRVYGGRVVCSNAIEADRVQAKGFDSVVIDEELFSGIGRHLDNSSLNRLTQDERDGRVIGEPTKAMIEAYDKVWEIVVRHGMNFGKDKPPLYSFDEGSDGGSETFGIYKDGNVYLRRDIGGEYLMNTIVEELCHHCAGCGDLTRDFQNWCCKLIARMIG